MTATTATTPWANKRLQVLTKTLSERFTEKYSVDPESGCWEWQACRNADGYGIFGGRGAHRFSYEYHVGPIPEGLTLDHLCRNRACVNPTHLEPVTALENMARGDLGRNMRVKTHCPHGHSYEGDNLIIRQKPNGRTQRMCRACRNESDRRRRRERRAA